MISPIGGGTASNLPVLVSQSANKHEAVTKPLAPGTLPDTDQPVLLWVDHLPLLALRLWVCDGGLEDAIPGDPSEHALPVAVPIRSMGEEPGNHGLALLVVCLAGMLPLLGG